MVTGVLAGAALACAQSDFLPAQIYREDSGVVIIEAENIDHHEDWTLTTNPDGYSGEGMLRWEGSRAPGGGNDDHDGDRQQSRDTHLIFRIMVTNPGPYRVDARNHHWSEDGDNDAWVNRLGWSGYARMPVKRVGDSHHDGSGVTWLDWGQRVFYFTRGLNELYFGARSPDFAVDRVVWHLDLDAFSDKAHDLSLPESRLIADPSSEPSSAALPIVEMPARSFPYQQDGFERHAHDTNMVRLPSSGSNSVQATTSASFPGPPGVYTVIFTYFLENNSQGIPSFAVAIDNQTVVTNEAYRNDPPGTAWSRFTVNAPDVEIGENAEVAVSVTSDAESVGPWRGVTFLRTDGGSVAAVPARPRPNAARPAPGARAGIFDIRGRRLDRVRMDRARAVGGVFIKRYAGQQAAPHIGAGVWQPGGERRSAVRAAGQ
jgi:hypothetical protein